jgi:hypothetical protein
VTVQERFIAYCRCTKVLKLFMLLLSPYSLNGGRGRINICIILGDRGLKNSENLWPNGNSA